VDDRAIGDVDQAEHEDPDGDGPGRTGIDELWQQGKEEQEDLRVEATDPEALRGLAQPGRRTRFSSSQIRYPAPATVSVFVTMAAADRATVDAFEEAVTAVSHVVQAQRLFGDPDDLLRVLARDLPNYQEPYDRQLATLPGVQRLRSTLVMKSAVHDRPLPP
jgi:DNA-binding Lrp family transcriptional regulator